MNDSPVELRKQGSEYRASKGTGTAPVRKTLTERGTRHLRKVPSELLPEPGLGKHGVRLRKSCQRRVAPARLEQVHLLQILNDRIFNVKI